MKNCSLVLLCLIGWVSSGCHHGMRANVELLNAEKRALEDELYALEFEYEDLCRRFEELQAQTGRAGGSSSSVRSTRERDSSRDNLPPPRRESGPDLSPPMIDEGVPIEPRIELPSGTDSVTPPRSTSSERSGGTAPTPPSIPPRSSTSSNSGPLPAGRETPARPQSLDPPDPRVTYLYLNPVLTGASDFDRRPGDDGIVVVVEPRNRDNTFVPLAGPISVVVLDPAKTPEQGRIVARWDIDANKAQESLRNSPTMRGFELRLPWPSAVPETHRLHLHVRYMTVDNRDLRADRPLFLNLSGNSSQSWTPRATTRYSVSSRPVPETPSNTPPPNETGSIGSESAPPTNDTSDLQQSGSVPAEQGSETELPASAGGNPAPPEWRPDRTSSR